LRGNFPNPFNPWIASQFSLEERKQVRVSLLDLRGRRVRILCDKVYNRGAHSGDWDGNNSAGYPVALGPYIIQMEADEFTESSKIMVVR
jgi:flagellar hook assembly protein FlgD